MASVPFVVIMFVIFHVAMSALNGCSLVSTESALDMVKEMWYMSDTTGECDRCGVALKVIDQTQQLLVPVFPPMDSTFVERTYTLVGRCLMDPDLRGCDTIGCRFIEERSRLVGHLMRSDTNDAVEWYEYIDDIESFMHRHMRLVVAYVLSTELAGVYDGKDLQNLVSGKEWSSCSGYVAGEKTLAFRQPVNRSRSNTWYFLNHVHLRHIHFCQLVCEGQMPWKNRLAAHFWRLYARGDIPSLLGALRGSRIDTLILTDLMALLVFVALRPLSKAGVPHKPPPTYNGHHATTSTRRVDAPFVENQGGCGSMASPESLSSVSRGCSKLVKYAKSGGRRK